MNGLLLGWVGLLLLASTALSTAGVAVFAVRPSRLRTLLDEGFRGAESLSRAQEREESIRGTVFVANALVTLAAAGLLVGGAVANWGALAMVPATAIAAVGVLAVGDGLPRLLAARKPIRLALLSAPILLALDGVLGPLLRPFFRIESVLRGGENGDDPSTERRELEQLTELGRKEGIVEEEEHQLVERAFRMDELTAWDIMTPRVDIFAWKNSLLLEEVVPLLPTVPYSRVPLYGETIDDVTGVLHVRDAYQAWAAGRRTLRLSDLSRDPLIVPGSLVLPRLLRDFKARRLHLAVVADEFGGTDGIVTLEDVIEELVGEIADETDVPEELIRRVSRNEIVVDGSVELREVNYAFNVTLPHLEYRSLNGYIVEELGRVPVNGEKIEVPGLEIEILEATESQVVKARILKTHSTAPEEA